MRGGAAFPSDRKLRQNVARFRQVNLNNPAAHHDALEFPDGEIVLVTNLSEGQTATVLQLPVGAEPQQRVHIEEPTPFRDTLIPSTR